MAWVWHGRDHATGPVREDQASALALLRVPPAGFEPATPASGVRSDRLYARSIRCPRGCVRLAVPLLSAAVDVSHGCHRACDCVTCDALVPSLCARLPCAFGRCTRTSRRGGDCTAMRPPWPVAGTPFPSPSSLHTWTAYEPRFPPLLVSAVVRTSPGLRGVCPRRKAHRSANRCTAAQGGCSGAHAFQGSWWVVGLRVEAFTYVHWRLAAWPTPGSGHGFLTVVVRPPRGCGTRAASGHLELGCGHRRAVCSPSTRSCTGDAGRRSRRHVPAHGARTCKPEPLGPLPILRMTGSGPRLEGRTKDASATRSRHSGAPSGVLMVFHTNLP